MEQLPCVGLFLRAARLRDFVHWGLALGPSRSSFGEIQATSPPAASPPPSFSWFQFLTYLTLLCPRYPHRVYLLFLSYSVHFATWPLIPWEEPGLDVSA